MEKQVKRFTVPFDFDWTYGVTIEKLRKDLDELEKLGVKEIEIETEDIYGDTSINIQAFCIRLETDDEYNKRINKERERQEAIKQKELADLEWLKKKYEYNTKHE